MPAYLEIATEAGSIVLTTPDPEPDPEFVPLTTLTLTNVSGSATPAATFLPFGQPFVRTDLSTLKRLLATWTPQGGEAVPVPIQLSGQSTWPNGSIKFATCLVKLPAIAGSGTGTLTLGTSLGTQETALPGSATHQSVLADLRANFPFTVALSDLTRGYTPVADGSGAWSWASDDQLALLDDVDARGRVRCEVVESGSLAVTFKCWGPVTDNSGGAAHPHLVVYAWYRCWLNSTSGAIDRVEYLHSLDQGWIEDLAGGSTLADLQICDAVVSLDGTPVPGLSWTGLRIVHHTMNALTNVAADGSDLAELTGGSHWSSGAPTLYAAVDRDYWNQTGLIGPYDLTVVPNAATDTAPANYGPGATTSSGKIAQYDTGSSRIERSINGTGDHAWVGLLPDWDTYWLYTQHRSWARSALCTALACGTMPMHVRNPTTGRIPNLLKTVTYSDSDLARLGTNRPNTHFASTFSGQKSTDVLVVTPVTNGPNGTNDHRGSDGGWGGPYDMSHHPGPFFATHLRTGQPWFLERLLVHGNAAIMRLYGVNNRNLTLPSGAAPDGAFITKDQMRSEGWAWRCLIHGIVSCPDDRPEKPYLQKIYDLNAAAAVAEIAALPANAKAIGTWYIRLARIAAPYAAFYNYETAPWMEDYVATPRAYGKLAMGPGAASQADTDAWLAHYAKFLGGRGGAEPTQACNWMVGQYHLLLGTGTTATNYFSWADMPSYTIFNGVKFDATAQSTGWIVGNASPADGTGLWNFSPGDRVLFYYGTNNAFFPPAELEEDVWYYIADVNHSTKRILISPNSNLSNPFTSYSAPAAALTGMSVRLANCPTPNPATPGSYFVSGIGSPINYVANYMGTLRLFLAAGAISPTADWVVAVEAKFAQTQAIYAASNSGYYETLPRWAIRPA